MKTSTNSEVAYTHISIPWAMGNTSMVTHRLEGVVTCPTRRSRPAQAERLQLVAAHHAEQGRKLLAEADEQRTTMWLEEVCA